MSTFVDPSADFYSIVASDSTNQRPFKALYVGTGGNVAVVGMNDAAVTFLNVPSGAILPVRGKRVNVTNTTASNIVALA